MDSPTHPAFIRDTISSCSTAAMVTDGLRTPERKRLRSDSPPPAATRRTRDASLNISSVRDDEETHFTDKLASLKSEIAISFKNESIVDFLSNKNITIRRFYNPETIEETKCALEDPSLFSKIISARWVLLKDRDALCSDVILIKGSKRFQCLEKLHKEEKLADDDKSLNLPCVEATIASTDFKDILLSVKAGKEDDLCGKHHLLLFLIDLWRREKNYTPMIYSLPRSEQIKIYKLTLDYLLGRKEIGPKIMREEAIAMTEEGIIPNKLKWLLYARCCGTKTAQVLFRHAGQKETTPPQDLLLVMVKQSRLDDENISQKIKTALADQQSWEEIRESFNLGSKKPVLKQSSLPRGKLSTQVIAEPEDVGKSSVIVYQQTEAVLIGIDMLRGLAQRAILVIVSNSRDLSSLLDLHFELKDFSSAKFHMKCGSEVRCILVFNKTKDALIGMDPNMFNHPAFLAPKDLAGGYLMGGHVLSERRKRKLSGNDEAFLNERPPQPGGLLQCQPTTTRQVENTPCRVVVDGRVTVNALMKKGYTRPRAKIELLPYHKEYTEYMREQLDYYETGVLLGVIVDEPMPGLNNFILMINDYIDRFGQRFSQEEHMRLIKLMYLIITKPGQWKEILCIGTKLLESLIGGSRLNHRNMILDWRPVFDLYYGLKYGKRDDLDADKISQAVYKLKRFYDIKEGPTIWEELQIYLSPRYDNMKFYDLVVRFLPVDMTGEEHRQFGASLWWDRLWNLYKMVEMGRFWGEELPHFFSSISSYAPDFMDFRPIYDDLFTRILRGMGLSLRMGRVAVGDGSGTASMHSFARWVGDLLGGPYSCQPHLTRLMKCLEAFLHPTNSGDHTKIILVFMSALCERVRDRYYQERLKKHKRQVPTEYYLTDKDISEFVNSFIQPSLTSLYNDNLPADTPVPKIVMGLCSLEPSVVIPKFLENIYPALTAVCEPHRLTNSLDCLIEIVYQIAADTSSRVRNEFIDNLVEEMGELPDVLFVTANQKDRNAYKKHLLTLRHHLIYLIDSLTMAIDINDVDKATLSLHNIILIFHLIPNVDCSKCVEFWPNLSEDEKQLCALTARLPAMVDNITDRILQIIQSLSICAPKNSTQLLGGLSDETTKLGEEEKTLKRAMDRCISALLCNSSGEIAKNLIDKIFNFISYNEFESSLATELATGVVAQTVFARPETWTLFGNYVLKNLRTVLTPEVRRQKELGSTALWFINLASGLFCTTSEAYMENKAICFEMIDLLTDCECKIAHDVGCLGIWFSLYMISRIYPVQQHVVSDMLNRPLNEWCPVREWAITYQEHEISMAWHVPDESRKTVIVEILNRFMFPLIEKVRNEKVDVYDLRRYINQIHMAYCGAFTCFPPPESMKGPAVPMGVTVLPMPREGPSYVTNKFWDVPYPDGSNVREVVVTMAEELVKTSHVNGTEDVQALGHIVSLLRSILDDNGIDSGEQNSVLQQTEEIFAYLNDPLLFGKKVTLNAFESFMYSIHLQQVCKENPLAYAPFHKRIMLLLTELALNDYPEVRNAAQAEVSVMSRDFPQCREDILDILVPILQNEESEEEKLKSVLTILVDCKWVTHCSPADKLRLWQALIKMPMVDRPLFTVAFDQLWAQIGKLAAAQREEESVSVELEKFAKEWLAERPKTGVWADFATDEQIEAAKEMRKEKLEERKRMNEQLVDILLELNADKTLHHRRSKLARTMLWRCQRQRANAATIKVLLSRLADDEPYMRARCADELSFWLKKNKPKTNRKDWICPQRSEQTPELLCGLREDNLCITYDSQNLPNTAEKWNSTIFTSRQYGCYKWPKKISVLVPASEEIVNRGPLTEAEEAIVDWFENTENMERWISLLLMEKREEKKLNENTWWLVKYVVRNFPNHEKIFNNILSILKRLMETKDRAGQRLAAEFFVGVAKGTKYHSFETLEALWKWLAPAVDKMFDQLNSEAEISWISAIPQVLVKEDSRRFFWLIEQLLIGMQRPSPSAYHQAARADIIPAAKWRDTEIMKRICEIAWKQLPTATMEMQRVGISTALKHFCTVRDANMFNDFAGLPERFHLQDTDFWLSRFTEKIAALVDTPSSTKSEPQHIEAALKEALDQAAMMRHEQSENDLTMLDDEEDDRKGLIYLRTLLEFLLQYYEECMTCLTPGIINLIPMLMEYANDDDSLDQSTVKDSDIPMNASFLIFDYMSSLLVNENYADRLFNVIAETFDRTCLWRVKVSVLKFLQVIVFSNVYLYERQKRPVVVTELVFKGLTDEQNEVRQESARCLEALTHFEYIKMDQTLLRRLADIRNSECRWQQHGSILGYGAIVMAHPYTIPLPLIPAVDALCKVSSRNAENQLAATNALREFRRSHRDMWTRTSKILGPSLVYQIENAIAPVYYA